MKNRHTWLTLAKTGPTHADDLKICDIHLTYVRQGLDVELIECDIPLQIVESMDNTMSIVIGELTATEEKAIDDVVKTSLGIGIAKESPLPKPKPTPSASAGSAHDLPRVEKELNVPSTIAGSGHKSVPLEKDCSTKSPKLEHSLKTKALDQSQLTKSRVSDGKLDLEISSPASETRAPAL